MEIDDFNVIFFHIYEKAISILMIFRDAVVNVADYLFYYFLVGLSIHRTEI